MTVAMNSSSCCKHYLGGPNDREVFSVREELSLCIRTLILVSKLLFM
jgi:hypothetical protein